MAIYENGVLRLLEPLDLPEHTRVRISVQPVMSPEEVKALPRREAARAILREAGLVSIKQQQPSNVQPLTEEERAALAERLPADLGLSDLIIEERREGH